MPNIKLKGLYLIAGSGLNVSEVESWLLPDVALVQYRNKCADQDTRLKEAGRLRSLCRQRNVGFIVNDDVELALEVNADGVHLGKGDPEISSARKVLGKQSIIGASCYASIAHALAAQRDGADYVAFGALFPSATKPEAERITLARLAEYRQRLTVPVCAIGGVTPDNLHGVLGIGIDLIAVNAAIAYADDPRAAVKRFIDEISRAGA